MNPNLLKSNYNLNSNSRANSNTSISNKQVESDINYNFYHDCQWGLRKFSDLFKADKYKYYVKKQRSELLSYGKRRNLIDASYIQVHDNETVGVSLTQLTKTNKKLLNQVLWFIGKYNDQVYVSQSYLAYCIGCKSRETVNRLMQVLKSLGLVESTYRHGMTCLTRVNKFLKSLDFILEWDWLFPALRTWSTQIVTRLELNLNNNNNSSSKRDEENQNLSNATPQKSKGEFPPPDFSDFDALFSETGKLTRDKTFETITKAWKMISDPDSNPRYDERISHLPQGSHSRRLWTRPEASSFTGDQARLFIEQIYEAPLPQNSLSKYLEMYRDVVCKQVIQKVV